MIYGSCITLMLVAEALWLVTFSFCITLVRLLLRRDWELPGVAAASPALLILILFSGILVLDEPAASSPTPDPIVVVVTLWVFELFHYAAALGLPLLPTVMTLLILNFLKPVEDYDWRSSVPLAPLIAFTGPAPVLTAVRDAGLSLIGVFMRPEGGLCAGAVTVTGAVDPGVMPIGFNLPPILGNGRLIVWVADMAGLGKDAILIVWSLLSRPS